MRLYLVQHGEAKTEQEDPQRPLTARGVADVRRVAGVAAAAGITAARIFHSGRTRARQTAEAWAEVLGAPLEVAEGLAPRDDPSVWVRRLTTERGDVLLVGHLPNLARLAAVLVADEQERPVVAFQQGGLVGLEQSETGWSVALVLPPAVCPPSGA
jgi:phosphohistidine phosphatase